MCNYFYILIYHGTWFDCSCPIPVAPCRFLSSGLPLDVCLVFCWCFLSSGLFHVVYILHSLFIGLGINVFVLPGSTQTNLLM